MVWLLIRISNRFKSGFNKKLWSGLESGFQIKIRFKSRFRILNPYLIQISDPDLIQILDLKSGFNKRLWSGFQIQIRINTGFRISDPDLI